MEVEDAGADGVEESAIVGEKALDEAPIVAKLARRNHQQIVMRNSRG